MDQAEYCMARMPAFQGQHGAFDYAVFSQRLYGQADL